MEPERKLSICIAEFPSVNKGRFHTALLLVDESSAELNVIQQLHFKDHANSAQDELDGKVFMVPYVKNGMRKQTADSIVLLTHVIGGYERDTLDAWNHILAHASEVRDVKPPFNSDNIHLPNALNCRMGVISALASIGIEVDESFVEEEFFKSDAGTKDNSIKVSHVFSFYTEERPDLDVVREQNEALSELLPKPSSDTPSFRSVLEHRNR